MRILSLFVLVLFLSACSAAQTIKANKLMATQYVGQTADAFFPKFGPPNSQHTLDSGDTMYLWSENPTVYGGGYGGYGQSLGKGSVATIGGTVVQCEVRIVAGKDGMIRQILSQNDTIGKWQLSRCNELFSGHA